MAVQPAKIWWSATEVAAARLPDMPGTKRGVVKLASRLGWQADPARARRRKGRGGGWEYSWQLFPVAARKALLAQVQVAKEAPEMDRAAAWKYFDGLPARIQAEARRRLQVLQAIAAQERSGQTRFLAVEDMAAIEGVGARTIWKWFEMVQGQSVDDWLPYLAPRHRAAARNVQKAACDKGFMDLLKADYLRLEKPPFSSCFRRVVKIARAKGWAVPGERTARRRLNETVPRVTQVFAREGYAGLARCFPPQTRDRSQMVAMEGV